MVSRKTEFYEVSIRIAKLTEKTGKTLGFISRTYEERLQAIQKWNEFVVVLSNVKEKVANE